MGSHSRNLSPGVAGGSTSPVGALESAKTEAFNHQVGGLTGENLDRVKKFLTTTAAQVNVKPSSDNQKITLTSQGNMLVKLIEFEHE